MTEEIPNPIASEQSLKRPLEGEQLGASDGPQTVFQEDSAVTKAEKIVRNGVNGHAVETSETAAAPENSTEPPSKRIKVDDQKEEAPNSDARTKVKGIALVKPE